MCNETRNLCPCVYIKTLRLTYLNDISKLVQQKSNTTEALPKTPLNGGVGTTNKRFVIHFDEKSQSKLNPIAKVDLENKQHM